MGWGGGKLAGRISEIFLYKETGKFWEGSGWGCG